MHAGRQDDYIGDFIAAKVLNFDPHRDVNGTARRRNNPLQRRIAPVVIDAKSIGDEVYSSNVRDAASRDAY